MKENDVVVVRGDLYRILEGSRKGRVVARPVNDRGEFIGPAVSFPPEIEVEMLPLEEGGQSRGSSYSPGEVVRLICGGPAMVVKGVSPDGIEVLWHPSDGSLAMSILPPEVLERA